MIVYFVGPDLFWPNYKEFVQKTRRLAAEAGFEALFPGELEGVGAQAIVMSSLTLIDRADGLIANLNPFRGRLEPDSGTVFECGYAIGRGKWVLGWVSDQRDLLTKAREWPEGPPPDGNVCRDGSEVEDFGSPLNIMLAVTAKGLLKSVEEAVAAAGALARG
ncbi:MAG: nucleoside 2-deoxyribosyltransferase [Deltaproteobacteria bacterium]|jgi:nucleoside 2-deoxyribosyltransferase|nr:nucleoside 2-deoxyribosyltransferase [Deltaproteobacteria bacterium]